MLYRTVTQLYLALQPSRHCIVFCSDTGELGVFDCSESMRFWSRIGFRFFSKRDLDHYLANCENTYFREVCRIPRILQSLHHGQFLLRHSTFPFEIESISQDPEILQVLTDVTSQPTSIGSFTANLSLIRKEVNKRLDGKKVSIADVKAFHQSQPRIQITRPTRKRFDRVPIYAPRPNNTWGSDTAFLPDLAARNQGLGAFLVFVDAFTKVAYVSPCKKATAEAVVTALTTIFDRENVKPEFLFSDLGGWAPNRRVNCNSRVCVLRVYGMHQNACRFSLDPLTPSPHPPRHRTPFYQFDWIYFNFDACFVFFLHFFFIF